MPLHNPVRTASARTALSLMSTHNKGNHHVQTSRRRLLTAAAAAAAVALLLPDVAQAAGGAMPYSSWLQQFRQSVSGEIAQIISLIVVVGGVGAWILAGQLEGLLQVLVRCGIGIAIIVGAATFITGFGGSAGALV